MESSAAASAATAVPLGRCDAAAVASRRGARGRLLMEEMMEGGSHRGGTTGKAPPSSSAVRCGTPSLVSLCLGVVVSSLERYAPESFGILSEEDFDQIVELRHRRTAPREGTGGLDGTGRVAPALSDKFLMEVETANPHLSESAVADRLVWKDCVNFRFREGGLTRPPALALPWPLLVDKVRSCAETLLLRLAGPAAAAAAAPNSRDANEANDAALHSSLQDLEACPMSVPLLQATGAGKTVRKCVKALKGRPDGPPPLPPAGVALLLRLERLLGSWMDMAEGDSSAAAAAAAPNKPGPSPGPTPNASREAEEKDLRIAEGCQSWRQLFRALKERADSCRSVQGERMRKIRSNLARDRPKVVKVRPAKHPQPSSSRLLARLEEREGKHATPSGSPSTAPSKMSKLWKETAVAAQRSQRPSVPSQLSPLRRTPAPSSASSSSSMPPSSSSSASFGAAVAFAAAASSKRSAKKGPQLVSVRSHLKSQSRLVQLQGGKQMRVPRHNASAVAAASGARAPAAARPTSSSAAPPAKVRRIGGGGGGHHPR